ncbi:response regulator [Rhodospirillum sp. A1_3_36]|uniref:response regulator n=1 Tax=Rhodospirillum sp. A1_3_36 TaxID=3391666 RepID=UPI0039A76917
MRILVIDDEDLARFTLREMLVSLGHEVLEARDGREGLARLGPGGVDLVVTDILMPNMDGVEFVMTARKDWPNLKVIAISGGGRTRNLDFLELAKDYGAAATLSKPFNKADLLSALEAASRAG